MNKKSDLIGIGIETTVYFQPQLKSVEMFQENKVFVYYFISEFVDPQIPILVYRVKSMARQHFDHYPHLV